MGPADFAYANLKDINAASQLRGNLSDVSYGTLALFSDSAESLTANVWNLFTIRGNLANQKLLQFSITNNSGGESDIETAFMRLV